MKTGIIRRVDDLGRIVLPKEIRRHLQIRENDALEISLKGQSIVLDPYCPLASLTGLADFYLNAFYHQYGLFCAITSTYHLIAAKGRNISRNAPLSERILGQIRKGETWITSTNHSLTLYTDSFPVYALYPVFSDAGTEGAFVLFDCGNPISDEALACAKFLADILTEHLKGSA